MEFKPVHIGPNTPYPDEPSQTIAPGWYVVGREVIPDDDPAVVIKIEQAFDEDGDDLSEQYANRVAEAMNDNGRQAYVAGYEWDLRHLDDEGVQAGLKRLQAAPRG